MQHFIKWINQSHATDPVLLAAISHLWFITIHPFADGNGRIARAITDMMLCRSEQDSHKFYSMSSQIREQRSEYYAILEKSQSDSLDISDWIVWALNACAML